MAIKVTSFLWEASPHKGSELLLLLALSDYCHDDGTGARPHISTLAAKTRLSTRNVRILIDKLTESGAISVEYNFYGRGYHRFTVAMGQMDASGRQVLVAPDPAQVKTFHKPTDAIKRIEVSGIAAEEREKEDQAIPFAPEESENFSEVGEIQRTQNDTGFHNAPYMDPVKRSGKLKSTPSSPPRGTEKEITVTPEIHPYWGFPRMSDGTYFVGDLAEDDPTHPPALVFMGEDELDGNAEVHAAHIRPGAYGPVEDSGNPSDPFSDAFVETIENWQATGDSTMPEIAPQMPQDAKFAPDPVSSVAEGAQNGPESLSAKPTKKRSTRDNGTEPTGFAEFYAEYPRHIAKADAIAAWRRQQLDSDEGMRARVMIAVGEQKIHIPKFAEGGEYCPYPATWLNKRRWEDELPQAAIGPVFTGEAPEDRQRRSDARQNELRTAREERDALYAAMDVQERDQVRWRNVTDRVHRQQKRGLPRAWRESLIYPPTKTTPAVIIARDDAEADALRHTSTEARGAIQMAIGSEWTTVLPQIRIFTREEILALRKGE